MAYDQGAMCLGIVEGPHVFAMFVGLRQGAPADIMEFCQIDFLHSARLDGFRPHRVWDMEGCKETSSGIAPMHSYDRQWEFGTFTSGFVDDQ